MDFERIYQETVDELLPSPELIKRISKSEETKRMKLSKKKIVIAALAACMLIGTTAFAAGHISSYRSWSNPDNEIRDFAEVCEKAKDLGIETDIPQSFSNGYAFADANISGMEGLDDNDNVVAKANVLSVRYTKAGKPDIHMFIDPVFEEPDYSNSLESRTVGETELFYDQVTYKFVPVNYELTEEDEQRMEDPHFEMSYGSDEVQVCVNDAVCFVKDDKAYNLFSWDGTMTSKEWLDMAEELLEE